MVQIKKKITHTSSHEYKNQQTHKKITHKRSPLVSEILLQTSIIPLPLVEESLLSLHFFSPHSSMLSLSLILILNSRCQCFNRNIDTMQLRITSNSNRLSFITEKPFIFFPIYHRRSQRSRPLHSQDYLNIPKLQNNEICTKCHC